MLEDYRKNEVLSEYAEIIIKKDKEIDRLNNIINELEKEFEYYFKDNLKYDEKTVNAIYKRFNKLKELKGE